MGVAVHIALGADPNMPQVVAIDTAAGEVVGDPG